MIDNQYNLVFTFDEDIYNMDFTEFDIDNLIYIYISEIPQNSYSVSYSKIQKDQLTLTLSFENNFQELLGYTIFL